jgi:hypothetical protein
MKDWLTDEKEAEQRLRRRTGLRGRWHELTPKQRDDIVVGAIAFIYGAVAIGPIYNLVTGVGSRPQNFTILGGMIGLVIAGYAAMAVQLHWPIRAILGAIGVACIAGFWGFGPM